MHLEGALHPKQEREERTGARDVVATGESLLTDWVSVSEPFLSSIQQVRKPFIRHSQTLEA